MYVLPSMVADRSEEYLIESLGRDVTVEAFAQRQEEPVIYVLGACWLTMTAGGGDKTQLQKKWWC